jgi:hypothetical protein
MRRSEGDNIQINHSDWLLAKTGVKTCTSRYGDKTSEYPSGKAFNFVSNDTGESLSIVIYAVTVKSLKDVTTFEAKCIGDYSWAEHVADFYNIYHTNLKRDVNEDTIVSLVYFKLVEPSK